MITLTTQCQLASKCNLIQHCVSVAFAFEAALRRFLIGMLEGCCVWPRKEEEVETHWFVYLINMHLNEYFGYSLSAHL